MRHLCVSKKAARAFRAESLRGGLEASCIWVAWRSVKMQSPGPHIQPADSGGWQLNKPPRWNLLKFKNFSTKVSIPSPLFSFLPATSFSLPFTEDEIFIWGFPEFQADSMNWYGEKLTEATHRLWLPLQITCFLPCLFTSFLTQHSHLKTH